MYIKTQNNTLLNMDRVTCMDILKSVNNCYAQIKAKVDGFEFEIYGGDINDVEGAYYTIQEGLTKGASLIDFSRD